jgi:hypothetical protein
MTSKRGRQARVYSALLTLYPADFRARYSGQMVQLFTDQLHDDGPGRSWLRAMRDIPGSALSEHLRRDRAVAHSITVAPTPASRILGLLGVIGGAVLLAAFVIEISPANNNVRLILFNLGAIAVVLAVTRAQYAANPRLALAGAIPALVANALYIVPVLRQIVQPDEPAPYGLVYTAIGGAMWLADLWFGLVTLRLGVVSRTGAVALVIGSFFAFIGMGIFGLTQEGTVLNAVIMAGLAIHALGWILLGLDVALGRRAPMTAS